MIDQAIIPELEIRTDISATLLQLGGYNDVQEIQPSGEVGGSYNGNKDKGWAYKWIEHICFTLRMQDANFIFLTINILTCAIW